MSMPREPDTDRPQEAPFIVARPWDVLLQLPLDAKWEFTRRHAYYLQFWRAARPIEGPASEAQRLLHEAAALILQQINFTGEPLPPESTVADVGIDQLVAIWRAGAVSPVRVRNLVILLDSLPTDCKEAIAMLLGRSLQIAPGDTAARFDLVKSITKGDHPSFDQMLSELLVQINPRAPIRAITSAVGEIAARFKNAHGIREHRRRNDKVEPYLAVWDRREGWTGAGYDLTREQSLPEIAKALRIPLKTAFDRYRAAFRLLVGHDFAPDLWAKVFGWPKLAGLLGEGTPRRTVHRPTRPHRPREVPDTKLSHGSRIEQEQGFLQQAGAASTDLECYELLSDIERLVRRNLSNEEIVADLDLSGPELVDYVRNRVADFG